MRAVMVLAVSLAAFVGTLYAAWADAGVGDAETVCPDPYGTLYNPGKLRSSWLPPGSYCDYRETHPELPERLAITGEPSDARTALLIVSAISAAFAARVLISSRARRA